VKVHLLEVYLDSASGRALVDVVPVRHCGGGGRP
jgi:hypothetical protein